MIGSYSQGMDISQADLHQQAATIARALRAAFPNECLPARVPLGCGYWQHDEQGAPAYHHNGGAKGLYVEAFFRGIAFARLGGPTPQHTKDAVRRFFMAPPPAKRWLDVVGDPLLAWGGVTSSWTFMSIPARLYYIPAYILTALPLLVTMRFEDLPYVSGRADPLEFVGETIDALTPPPGFKVWEALR